MQPTKIVSLENAGPSVKVMPNEKMSKQPSVSLGLEFKIYTHHPKQCFVSEDSAEMKLI